MILLVGATGRTGREVVKHLSRRRVRFRALVRDQVTASSVLPSECDLVVGDLRDMATLPPALAGVTTVFLLTSNELDQVVMQRNLWRAARGAGVERIVKLSGTRPHDDPTRTVGHWHAVTEREIRESGLGYTFLQPNFLTQNFLIYAGAMIERGVLETPTTTGRVACVDYRDVAACAAAVLTENGHAGATYVLTGADAITAADVAASVATIIGKPVRHKSVSTDSAHATLCRAGLPGWLSTYVMSLYESFERGDAAVVSPDVARLLGRPPTPVGQCLADHLGQTVVR